MESKKNANNAVSEAYDNLYYNRRWHGSISDLSEPSAGNLKEKERHEHSRFVPLFKVWPRWGGEGAWTYMTCRVSLPVDKNVVSGPFIY